MIIIKARFFISAALFFRRSFYEIIIRRRLIGLLFTGKVFISLMAKNIRLEYISDEKQNI